MHALTGDLLHSTFVNAHGRDLEYCELPLKVLVDGWDHLDFLAWRDPKVRGRGYVIVEHEGRPVGIVVRAADASSRARSAMCNMCHSMQPAVQVSLFNARRAGEAGARGDTIGTYICTDLTCHENVRLAGPLAPNEFRASVDRRIDGTRQRLESFVVRVLGED